MEKLTQLTRTIHEWLQHTATSVSTDTRAISELIGYSVVFGVIISVVVSASLAGGPVVNDQSTEQALEATEQVFTQLDTEIRQVQSGTDNQQTQLQVPAGQLRQTQPTNITIEQPGSGSNNQLTVEITPLEYTNRGQSELLYTGSFMARSFSGDFTSDASIRMVHPTAANDHNPVFVLPELGTETEVSAYSTTQRIANVRFTVRQLNKNTSATTQTFERADGDLDVTVESPTHAAAWESYFQQHPAVDGFSRTDAATTFSFTITFGQDGVTGDTVTVTSEQIIVSFTRR